MYNHLLTDFHHYPIWPLVLPVDLSHTFPIRLLLFSVSLPHRDSWHIHFSLVTSFQIIRPPCVTFRNKLFCYHGGELLAPLPTPSLEDHSLLVVRNCLFSIFAATLHNWRSTPSYTTRGCAMPLWQGPTEYGFSASEAWKISGNVAGKGRPLHLPALVNNWFLIPWITPFKHQSLRITGMIWEYICISRNLHTEICCPCA
jgi:hypothetical protein